MQAWLEDSVKEFWPQNIWSQAQLTATLVTNSWGICGREVDKRPHSTRSPLQTKTAEVMTRLDKTMVTNAC